MSVTRHNELRNQLFCTVTQANRNHFCPPLSAEKGPALLKTRVKSGENKGFAVLPPPATVHEATHWPTWGIFDVHRKQARLRCHFAGCRRRGNYIGRLSRCGRHARQSADAAS